MAGINTAITGAGTLAGGGAIATGFAKQSKDAAAEKIEIRLEELRKIEQSNPTSTEFTQTEADNFTASFDAYRDTAKQELQKAQAELDKLTRESKNLGNWRMGLMAGNTATNVAGAIIASGNKVDGDLQSMIDACKLSVDNLRKSRIQARLDGEDTSAAERIISECGKWDSFDASKINSKADVAKWASIAGAATGAAGTITSAVANTDGTRNDNTDSGKAKEKNLNTASNVLAIYATAASATATVFNATQIAAIKKAAALAESCEGVLK